jgi:agmatine deiminase
MRVGSEGLRCNAQAWPPESADQQVAAIAAILPPRKRSGADMTSRRIPVLATLWLAWCGVAGAQSLVPEHMLAGIVDDDETILPRGFAPGERERWVLPDLSGVPLAPPPGDPRAQAEYEKNAGLLIRWGAFDSLLTEMTVAVTTLDHSGRMFIVVSGPTQQATATSTLQGAGANMSRVEFIVAATNTVWIRDYGPRYVELDGDRAIIDHTYNRPRPADNQVPSAIASQWNEARYELPLTHGGGNFHLFANREALMTDLILAENPNVSAATVQAYYAAYQGLDLTIVEPLPSSFDSTQHIDMWLLPVADDKVIIGEYAEAQGNGVPRRVTDGTAAMLADRGYQVLRTPGWRASGAHYTYTNAVIVNNLVLICRFNGYDVQNQQARSVFESAFPGRTIHAVDCSAIISWAGAIHCIVMHVPAKSRVFRASFEADD